MISATGNSARAITNELALQRRNQSGFTLIELLLVLFIIGLMSTLVGLTFSAADAPARGEKDRIIFVLEEARDYAVLNGFLLRLTPNKDGNGYEFAERRIRLSVPTEEDRTALRLPAPIRTAYWAVIDSGPFAPYRVTEGVRLAFAGADERGTIIINPSGDVQMSKIVVTDQQQSFDVVIDEEGQVVSHLREVAISNDTAQ